MHFLKTNEMSNEITGSLRNLLENLLQKRMPYCHFCHICLLCIYDMPITCKVLWQTLWDITVHGSWLVKLNPHKGIKQEKITSTGSSIFCSLPIFFPLHSLDATLKRPMSSYDTIILYLILPSRKQGFEVL